MNESQATILIRMIEIATDGNWPHTADGLIDMGYDPTEVVDACRVLSDLAHESPFIEECDF